MWWPQPKQATSATMAIVYITVGALMDVWTVIYWIYLRGEDQTTVSSTTYLWVYGFFFSGMVLMAIGFGLGYIGRSAKQAEVSAPPPMMQMPTAGQVVPAPVAQPVQGNPPGVAPAVSVPR